jgi:hypothetical protein
MDRTVLSDLETNIKTLKAAVIRSQNGIAGLMNISKLGHPTIAATAPGIFTELHELEVQMQRILKSYRDSLTKSAATVTESQP